MPLAQLLSMESKVVIATQVRTVSHAGRHRDHRQIHKTSHHAGKSAFHPRHNNSHVTASDDVQLAEHTMDTRYAYIIDTMDFISQKFRCYCSFLRNWNIRRSGAYHRYGFLPRSFAASSSSFPESPLPAARIFASL